MASQFTTKIHRVPPSIQHSQDPSSKLGMQLRNGPMTYKHIA